MEYDPSDAEAFFSGILKSSLSSELMYRLNQSLEVTDDLWELIPVVVAAGEEHDRESPADMAGRSAAARRLTVDQCRRVRSVADVLLEAAYEQQVDDSIVAALTIQEALADPFGILRRLTDIPEQTALVMSMLEQAASLSVDEVFYFHAYVRAKQKSERTPTLLRALFTTTIGTIEPLLSRLVVLLLYYGGSHRYGSLADANLQEDARRLCFGPPEKWRRSLVEDLGVTTASTVVDWERLTSLWEDRNVIVHRGSVTDSRHGAKTKTEVGSVLSPDVATVRRALDIAGATRYALVACVWDRLEPGRGAQVAHIAGSLVWESLRAGRWEQAELLGQLEWLLSADPQDNATGQVHRWLATDMGRGHEAIRTEVESWDVTGLPRIYTVAQHVLLRRDEQALALMSDLLDAGEIRQTDVDTWPLFDRLRG